MGLRLRHKILPILILSTILLLGTTPISGAESQPAFIRQKLARAAKIWPGQRVTLYITLYTTTSFSGSTRFELPEVSGMLVLENEDRPLLGTEMIEDTSYIFKRHEIIIFPLQSGRHTLPSFNVEFSFQKDHDQTQDVSFKTAGIDLDVLEIPGITAREPVITTPDLQVKDLWLPNLRQAKLAPIRVGDALTRTITLIAEDLPGMMLPPLQLQKVSGLGFYRKAPQVEDQRNRGAFTGRRIETITYVCEETGKFTIPGLNFKWWNPKSETLQNVSLPEITIKVTANPLLQKEGAAAAAGSTVFPWIKTTLFILFSTLIFVLLLFFRPKKPSAAAKAEEHEKELFIKFQKLAATHDPAATMQALLAWLDQSKNGGKPSTLEHFYTRVGDPELKKEIKSLEAALYTTGSEQSWSGTQLLAAVQQARKNLKQRQSQTKTSNLPALNPQIPDS